MDAALTLRQDGDLLRLGLEGSALREMSTAQVSRSELEALVTIGRGSQALALATNCPLREDRLHMLAVVARSEKERGTPLGDDVLDQIRQLHSQIDPKSLSTKAIDIAADLFPCCPDLAIGLVENGFNRQANENELDIAYVRLSIATAIRGSPESHDHDDLEKIRARIKNPRLRSFTESLPGVAHSATELISEVNSFETATDKLHMIRQWILEHSTRDDAIDVSEYGLNVLVQATAYAPNMRVLRELSTPLIHTKSVVRARPLVKSFDGQASTVDEQGPTDEVVRLQLNLSVAESLYDVDACANRLVDVCLTVDELTDLSTKTSCLSRLLSALHVIESSEEIEKKEKLTEFSSQELERTLSELLNNTAEQADVTRRTIQAIASFDASRAIATARSLNTSARREEALLTAIDAIIESEPAHAELEQIRRAYSRLEKSDSRDFVATMVAEYFARCAARNEENLVRDALPIFADVFFSVANPMERCRVLCLLHAFQHGGLYRDSESDKASIDTRISDAMKLLEPGWQTIETGFRIARSFANHNTSLANRYLRIAEANRETTAFSSSSAEWSYQACLRLTIRAFAGQIGHGYDPRDDMSRLSELIDRIPSLSLRVQMWGELAMHLFLKEHSDDASRVVRDHLITLFDMIPSGPTKDDTLVAVAPALYRGHRATAIDRFHATEPHQRDLAFMTCGEFILEKHIPSDPYERHNNGYDISHQDAQDVVEIAKEIRRDNLVYALIVALADTLTAPRYYKVFTEQQKADIVGSIENLADAKFPDHHNIQHIGYVIASKAQVLRITRGVSDSWKKLIAEARAIENMADRAYVLAIIGQGTRDATLRDAVFEEAISVTESIPCNYDRLGRLSNLAEMIEPKSSLLSRACLKSAVSTFNSFDDLSGAHIVRNMIDTAFKVDEEFAAGIVSMVDDDPARAAARYEMTRRLETLRARDAIGSKPETWDQVDLNGEDLARSAWLALGSLNAELANDVSMEQLRPALRAAGRCALRHGYPILAWVIENAVRRFAGTIQSRSTIRLMFEGAVSATRLAELAADNVSLAFRRGTSSEAARTSDGRLMVRPGDRVRAEKFVRNWLERCASGHVYICDQYFRPADLRLVKLVQSVAPDIDIAVLTSRHDHPTGGSFEDSYRRGWRKISSQRPPRVKIVAVGVDGSGKSPIHDRCILTERSGLEIGTSWNSLGQSQDSNISVLTARDASAMSDRVREFLVEERREYGSDRLIYDSATL